MRPIVSEQYRYVIGVDSHAATHTLAVLIATGQLGSAVGPGLGVPLNLDADGVLRASIARKCRSLPVR